MDDENTIEHSTDDEFCPKKNSDESIIEPDLTEKEAASTEAPIRLNMTPDPVQSFIFRNFTKRPDIRMIIPPSHLKDCISNFLKNCKSHQPVSMDFDIDIFSDEETSSDDVDEGDNHLVEEVNSNESNFNDNKEEKNTNICSLPKGTFYREKDLYLEAPYEEHEHQLLSCSSSAYSDCSDFSLDSSDILYDEIQNSEQDLEYKVETRSKSSVEPKRRNGFVESEKKLTVRPKFARIAYNTEKKYSNSNQQQKIRSNVQPEDFPNDLKSLFKDFSFDENISELLSLINDENFIRSLKHNSNSEHYLSLLSFFDCISNKNLKKKILEEENTDITNQPLSKLEKESHYIPNENVMNDGAKKVQSHNVTNYIQELFEPKIFVQKENINMKNGGKSVKKIEGTAAAHDVPKAAISEDAASKIRKKMFKIQNLKPLKRRSHDSNGFDSKHSKE